MGGMGGVGGTSLGSHRPPERPSVREAAREYLRREWVPIPLRPRSKQPAQAGWRDLRISAANVDAQFEPPNNIGIVLGEASGAGDGQPGWSLVDVDCDTLEAAQAAARLLPYTGCVSGRRGKPASHYWYYVYGPIKTATFSLPRSGTTEITETTEAQTEKQRVTPGLSSLDSVSSAGSVVPFSGMIVELRADGCQTMVPPSIHPSGELVRWEGPGARMGDPARIPAGELLRLVTAIAVVAVMARRYPAQGTRDEAAMALTGMLMRGGWTAERADELVTTLARVAGDEEWKQRAKGAQTAKALAAGGLATGATRFAQLLAGRGGGRAHRGEGAPVARADGPERG